MSYHPKKSNPEVTAQAEHLIGGILGGISASVARIKKLDKSLKGYTDIGLMMYALEKLEEDLKQDNK